MNRCRLRDRRMDRLRGSAMTCPKQNDIVKTDTTPPASTPRMFTVDEIASKHQ